MDKDELMCITYGSRQFAFFSLTHKLPTRKKKANCGYRFPLWEIKNLVAYKNSDQNSNLLIFHIHKYFFIYLIFNNITFKMYIQNYK